MTQTQRWIRNVGPLPSINSRAVEIAIQQKLEEAYPRDQFPFDILVAYTWVHITNYRDINQKKPIPTPSDRDKLTPILEAVEHVIANLKVRPEGIQETLAGITVRIYLGLLSGGQQRKAA
jgi:hypothetical protein